VTVPCFGPKRIYLEKIVHPVKFVCADLLVVINSKRLMQIRHWYDEEKLEKEKEEKGEMQEV
jgi:hypothetical protein